MKLAPMRIFSCKHPLTFKTRVTANLSSEGEFHLHEN